MIPLFKDAKPRESKKLLVYCFWLLVKFPNMITMSNCTALLIDFQTCLCVWHIFICVKYTVTVRTAFDSAKRNIHKFTVKMMTLFPKALLWTYITQGKAFFHLVINIFAIAASATLPWTTNQKTKKQQKLTSNINKQATKTNKQQNKTNLIKTVRSEDIISGEKMCPYSSPEEVGKPIVFIC